MNTQVYLLLIIASIDAIWTIFILMGGRNKINIAYCLFVIFVALWTMGITFFILGSESKASLYIANFYYIAAAGIISSLYYFSTIFPLDININRFKKIATFSPVVILALIFYYYPNFVISGITINNGVKNVVLNNFNYISYIIFFLLFFSLVQINFYKAYTKTSEETKKVQLKFVVSGIFLSFLFAMTFNLFYPFFGYYNYIWLGPLCAIIMISSMGYAVAKHHLFNIKIVATELITFILWIFVLVRIFVAETVTEKILNGGLLALLVIFGIILIRSVLKEVHTREKIEALAVDLEKANERLKELDQQKSEFVSLASHQLRGPLTAIKGYASLILEGDFGDVPAPIKDAVDKIFVSTKALVTLVGDYLDVSRIEQGRMKYDMSVFNFKELVTAVIGELKPNVDAAKLDLSFDFNSKDTYVVNADQGKIKQVISNLIDNSIKYTPKGWIKVKLEKNPSTNKILLSIKDCGVGIRPDVLPRLFEKFTRAPDASKTNIMGTGLGLYVAKKMIEAHNGRVWAESEGEGKGSTFNIELNAS